MSIKSLQSPSILHYSSHQASKNETCSEKIYDKLCPLKSILLESILSVFLRIPKTIVYGVAAYNPMLLEKWVPDSVHLTNENMKKGMEKLLYQKEFGIIDELEEVLKKDPSFIKETAKGLIPAPHSLARYEYLKSRIQCLAQKIGLDPSVEIYVTKVGNASSAIGSAQSGKSVIRISHDLLMEKNSEELDFIISHELSHIKNNDYFNSFKKSIIVVVFDVVFFPVSLIVEIIANTALNHLDRKQEKAADLNALRILNTNVGAVRSFQKAIDQNIFLRKESKYTYTAQGNNRADLRHPPLTERLAYAKNFSFNK